jgi:hypothetical protein
MQTHDIAPPHAAAAGRLPLAATDSVRRVGPRDALLLGALVIAAFAIRCIGIGRDAVWIDEAASIGIGTLPWSVLFGEMARIEASPPGYYAIAKLVGLVAGPEGLPLRLLSAAAAALALVPLWLFCRDSLGARVAWTAALAVALHATLFRLSQDGRTYTILFLLFCCALLAAWHLLEAARRGIGAAGPVIALGLCQGAMLWLHSTAAIANVSLNVFILAALLAARQGLGRGIALLALADIAALLVAAAPIWWALRHASEGAFVTRWIAPPGLVEAALIYARGLVAPFQSPVSAVTALLTIAGVVGGTLAPRRPGWPVRFGLFAMLAAAGILFPLISQSWPVMLDRTVLFLAAPLATSVAAGVALLPRPAFLAGAALFVALHGFGVVRYLDWPIHKEQWREAAALLRAEAGPDDRIIVTDSVFAAISLRMAATEGGGLAPPVILVPAESPLESRSATLLDPAADTTVESLCARLRGAGSVWLVARPVPGIVEDDPGFSSWNAVLAVLRGAGGERIEDRSLPTLRIERWRVPGC